MGWHVHSIPRRSRSEAAIIIAQSPALAIIFTFMVDSTFDLRCLRDIVGTFFLMNDEIMPKIFSVVFLIMLCVPLSLYIEMCDGV